jgi:hypothetical protein
MNGLARSLNALRQRSMAGPMGGSSMAPQYLLFVVLAVALPVAILLSVELWMVTTYSGVMDAGWFYRQYFDGVYRYRILGREQFLLLYHFLQAHFADRAYPLPRDPLTTLLFYATFAVSNGVYMAIGNLILLSLMWVKRRGFLDRDVSLYLYYTMILTLSMAIVTPYDQLGYLLLLVGVLGARQRSLAAGVLLIAVSAVAGTLNRETEFLLASFLATLALVSPAVQAGRYWIYLAVDVVLSGAAYVGVRLALPGKVDVIQDVTLGGKWAVESFAIVLLLFAGAIVLGMRLHRSIVPAVVLLLMRLPYLLTVFIGGIFRELRLSVPVLLCLVCVYLFLRRETDGTWASSQA